MPIQNGGHCQPLLFEHPDDPSIGHFELANFHALQDLVQERDIDCEFVVQPGCRAIYSSYHLEHTKLAIAKLKDNAPELASMMRLVTDEDELASLRIATAMGAVVTSIAGRMWPYKLVARVLEDLITSTNLHGTFNLQTLTPVTSLVSRPLGVVVETPRGTILAKKVILATNAYTSHLLPTFAPLIVPCRGQMSSLLPPSSVAGENRLKTSFGFLGDGMDDYLIQRPSERGGHLMFGGGRHTARSIGETNDNFVDDATAHYLKTRLFSALDLPAPKEKVEMEATHMWTGIMGFSRDDVPWVGPVPDTHGHIFMAAGFTGHGMPNTWLSGKAVAEMAMGSLHGKDQIDAVESAANGVKLPRAYVLTKERMDKAMQLESVEKRDEEEFERGRADARRK